MNRQRYQLQIETASGISADESVRALRAFLKCALRSYRIRCTSAEPLTPIDDAGTAQDDPGSPPIVESDK